VDITISASLPYKGGKQMSMTQSRTGSAMSANEKPCLIGLDRISEIFLKVWREIITKKWLSEFLCYPGIATRLCAGKSSQKNPHRPKKKRTV
jgi:hypothetical protein